MRQPQVRDALTALLFGVCYFGGVYFLLRHGWYPHNDTLYRTELTGIVSIGVLLTRERWPVATFLLVIVGYPEVFGTYLRVEFHVLPILLAAYTISAKGRLRTVWVLLLTEFAVVRIQLPFSEIVFMATNSPQDFWWWNPTSIALVQGGTLAVILLGRAAFRQNQTNDELRQRHAELERLRQIETDQVVAAERTRIARELHDVVAHHISAMVIKAQAADRVADSRPGEIREAVRWIAANGQETLAAMRHVVRVLRYSEAGGSLEPQVTLAELPQIAERMTAVGLAVELRLPDLLPVLPAAVELATVRIVQEALTNALVHAKAGRALVELEIGPSREIRFAVHDDGAAGAPPTAPIRVSTNRPSAPGPQPGLGLGGNGLVGMRERAASCGGTIAFGQSPLGGWMVTAVLPVRVASLAHLMDAAEAAVPITKLRAG